MSKSPAFIIGTKVLKEEYKQQQLLDFFLSGYFGICPEDIEFKYSESSQTVLTQMMIELVGDQKLLFDWLFDEFDQKTGLHYEVETLCGKVVDLNIHTADDLYDCILFGNARRVNNCDLCRKVCREYGVQCW